MASINEITYIQGVKHSESHCNRKPKGRRGEDYHHPQLGRGAGSGREEGAAR